MGTGRATTIQPKSLKKIYPFDRNILQEILTVAPDADDSKIQYALSSDPEHFGKIGNLPSPEMVLIKSKPDYQNVRECLNLNCENKLVQSSKVDGKEQEYEYEILGNDDELDRVAFKNGKIVPHIDGILQDTNTGEFLFFIAIDDVENGGSVDISTIEEGCIVEYTDWYAGVCEVILHKRGQNGEIIGDIDLNRDKSVIVRYVEITDVKEVVDSNSDRKKTVRENTNVGLYGVVNLKK